MSNFGAWQVTIEYEDTPRFFIDEHKARKFAAAKARAFEKIYDLEKDAAEDMVSVTPIVIEDPLET